MIELGGVVLDLGGNRVLDGLSFMVPSGQKTALLGPNGAGKTTTMRVIATLLLPQSGRVEVSGYATATAPLDVRRSIGLLTEEPGMYDRLTPREQLVFAARVAGLSEARAHERVGELSSLLGFEEYLDTRSARLSKGTRQKVALVRALAHDPPVLLLDEPTSGLDVAAAAAIEDFLASPAVADKTVLLSTHFLEQAERLCSHVVGIFGGRAFVHDGVEDIRRSDAGGFRTGFLALLAKHSLGDATQ